MPVNLYGAESRRILPTPWSMRNWKIDPESANNPLINPPADVLAKSKGWAALTDEQTQEYNTAYAAVTGG